MSNRDFVRASMPEARAERHRTHGRETYWLIRIADGRTLPFAEGPTEAAAWRAAAERIRAEALTISTAVSPTGIAYTDRTRARDGDHVRLAFLDFATLTLRLEDGCPDTLAAAILRDTRAIQEREGEAFEVSTAGQTVILGHDLPAVRAQRKGSR